MTSEREAPRAAKVGRTDQAPGSAANGGGHDPTGTGDEGRPQSPAHSGRPQGTGQPGVRARFAALPDTRAHGLAEIRPALLALFSRRPRRMLYVTSSGDGDYIIRAVAGGEFVCRISLRAAMRGIRASVVFALCIVAMLVGLFIGRMLEW